jgi:RNA polymerase sigma factor (sigma-70 family)
MPCERHRGFAGMRRRAVSRIRQKSATSWGPICPGRGTIYRWSRNQQPARIITMSDAAKPSLLKQVWKLVGAGGSQQPADVDLMQRFTVAQDTDSFSLLVERHGPMVLGVCRRVLAHTQDAEDAFQATFLVLARKAASIRKQQSVGSWLHGVALRLAMKMRAVDLRRSASAAPRPTAAPRDPLVEVIQSELRQILDEALHELPERYRCPLVLCYLEGKSRDEAGLELGWSLGTVKKRLERGRKLLRAYLTRRGIALSTAALAALLDETATMASPVSVVLAATTTKAAALVAAGMMVVPELVSVRAAALAEGLLRTMFASKLKLVAAVLAVVSVLAGGVGVVAYHLGNGQQSDRQLAIAATVAATDEALALLPAAATAPQDVRRRVSLAGRVTDSAGRPVAEASVSLRMSPYARTSINWHAVKTPNLSHTHSDAQGGFAFQGVSMPAGDVLRREIFPLDLIVHAAGHGLAWRHVEALDPSEPIAIKLPPEERVTGRVLDAKGKPVRGIRIQVLEMCSPDADARPTLSSPKTVSLEWSEISLFGKSDDQGRFEIAGIPPGMRALLAVDDKRYLPQEVLVATVPGPLPALPESDPGAPGKVLRQRSVDTGPLAITVKPCFRLRARIIFGDTRKPAAFARYAEPPMSWPANRAADAQGRFELEHLHPGTLHFNIYPPLKTTYLALDAAISLTGEPRDVEQTFELTPGALASGKVVDDKTGTGIPGMGIHYIPAVRKWPGAASPPILSEPDGAFRMAVLPGKGRLVLHGIVPGYETPAWSGSLDDVDHRRFVHEIDVTTGQELSGIKLALSRGMVFTGRVVDTRGNAVPDALVKYTRRKGSGSLPEQNLRTDSAGKVTLSGFPADEEVAVAILDGKRRSGAYFKLPPRTPGADTNLGSIKLEPLLSLAGRIVDDENKPIRGAVVRLRVAEGNVFAVTGEPIATDRDGKFRFDGLLPGMRYMVQADAKGHVEQFTAYIDPQPGRALDLPDLKLTRADQSIAGVVVDTFGRPVFGARVAGKIDIGNVRHEAEVHSSDRQGRFRVSGLPRGDVQLSVTVPGKLERAHIERVQAGTQNARIVVLFD